MDGDHSKTTGDSEIEKFVTPRYLEGPRGDVQAGCLGHMRVQRAGF